MKAADIPPLPSGDAPPPGWMRLRMPAVDWRAKARWLGAEYLVVVLGVLTAVALNSWWTERQDRAKERAYLQQLAADLEETERTVSAIDRYMLPFERAPRRLAQAHFLAEPPPRDSVIAWAAVAPVYETVSPVRATAEALVSAGDLGLIRDDSLRVAIAAYLDAARSSVRSYEAWQASLLTHTGDYVDRAPISQVFAEAIGPAALDSLDRADSWQVLVPPRASVPAFDAEAFVRDETMHRLMTQFVVDKYNLRLQRSYFRRDAAALRERVEAALAG